jgi:hypothetical protein
MTTWILVIMLCERFCQPIQAEFFTTKEECLTHVNKVAWYALPKEYCVPLINTKRKER